MGRMNAEEKAGVDGDFLFVPIRFIRMIRVTRFNSYDSCYHEWDE
jgi:hypothetical protein